jgi:hypothetical protein
MKKSIFVSLVSIVCLFASCNNNDRSEQIANECKSLQEEIRAAQSTIELFPSVWGTLQEVTATANTGVYRLRLTRADDGRWSKVEIVRDGDGETIEFSPKFTPLTKWERMSGWSQPRKENGVLKIDYYKNGEVVNTYSITPMFIPTTKWVSL